MRKQGHPLGTPASSVHRRAEVSAIREHQYFFAQDTDAVLVPADGEPQFGLDDRHWFAGRVVDDFANGVCSSLT